MSAPVPKQANPRPMSSRHRARGAAVQALYQWQSTGLEPESIITQFLDDGPRMDRKLFRELLLGTIGEVESLDTALLPFLDRPISQVDPVERAILRLATYELLKRMEVPLGVVINEAIELAKTYGAEAGHRFVNGVLDKMAAKVRPEAAAVKAAKKTL
jgi:transcription antitermination protein NusB